MFLTPTDLIAAHPSCHWGWEPGRQLGGASLGRAFWEGAEMTLHCSGLFLLIQAALWGAEFGGRQVPPMSDKTWFCHLSVRAEKWTNQFSSVCAKACLSQGRAPHCFPVWVNSGALCSFACSRVGKMPWDHIAALPLTKLCDLGTLLNPSEPHLLSIKWGWQ